MKASFFEIGQAVYLGAPIFKKYRGRNMKREERFF